MSEAKLITDEEIAKIKASAESMIGAETVTLWSDTALALIARLRQSEAANVELRTACEYAYQSETTDSVTGEPIPPEDVCYCTDTGMGEMVDGVMVGDLLLCLPCRLRAALAKAPTSNQKGA